MQASYRERPEEIEAREPLRAFASKHRPTLSEAGLRALQLGQDPDNADRSFLLVELKPRPCAARPEQAYYVIGAAVVTYDALAQRNSVLAQDMRDHLHALSEQQRARGREWRGAFFVVLTVVGASLHHITSVGWSDGYRFFRPWRKMLKQMLDEGIVR